MKTYNTLLFPLVVVSLLGCNSLAANPNSGNSGKMAVDNAAYKVTAVKIDDVPWDLSARQSDIFSTNWVEEPAKIRKEPNKPVTRQSTVVSKPYVKKRTDKTVIVKHLAQKSHWQTQFFAKRKFADQNINAKAEPNEYYEIDDLWKHIRKGYGLPVIDNRKIQSSINKYVKHPSYFKRITTNAHPYLYYIVKELELRKMPLELALLPAIESAYDPLAVSHMGAAGLWQFIPTTGKYYGLTQNKWYDERRDIIKSTVAALVYLQKLNKMFDGDWFLTLAAYNYGEGNVKNAIKKNKKLGKPTDYWSLKLPKETRNYVPKFLAMSKIVAYPQTYGVKLETIDNWPFCEWVNVGHQIELSLAAKLADISLSEMKGLNPGYRRGTTPPYGPHHIAVPFYKASQFKQRVAEITPEQMLPKGSKSASRGYPNKTQQHRVKKGDNLWHIAKHYDTTVSLLRQLNNIKGNLLIIGQLLIVPTTVAGLQKSVISSKKKKIVYTVKSGDCLSEIASDYKVSIKKLSKWNPMLGDKILQKGQKLTIWLAK